MASVSWMDDDVAVAAVGNWWLKIRKITSHISRPEKIFFLLESSVLLLLQPELVVLDFNRSHFLVECY